MYSINSDGLICIGGCSFDTGEVVSGVGIKIIGQPTFKMQEQGIMDFESLAVGHKFMSKDSLFMKTSLGGSLNLFGEYQSISVGTVRVVSLDLVLPRKDFRDFRIGEAFCKRGHVCLKISSREAIDTSTLSVWSEVDAMTFIPVLCSFNASLEV